MENTQMVAEGAYTDDRQVNAGSLPQTGSAKICGFSICDDLREIDAAQVNAGSLPQTGSAKISVFSICDDLREKNT